MPSKNKPGCNCCGGNCTHCSTGTMPEEWQVDLTGFTDVATCTNCAELNASWIFANTILISFGACIVRKGGIDNTNVCNFGPSGDSGAGGTGPAIDVSVYLSGGTYRVRADVVINSLFAQTTIVYEKNYGASKPNCTALSGESLPLISVTNNGFGNICTTSSACTITAL